MTIAGRLLGTPLYGAGEEGEQKQENEKIIASLLWAGC